MSAKSFDKSVESGDKINISEIQKQTAITINSLKEQTSQLLVERGDELKHLQDVAESLSKQSSEFSKCTSNIKRKQKRYKCNLTMFLFILLLIFILAIVVIFISFFFHFRSPPN